MLHCPGEKVIFYQLRPHQSQLLYCWDSLWCSSAKIWIYVPNVHHDTSVAFSDLLTLLRMKSWSILSGTINIAHQLLYSWFRCSTISNLFSNFQLTMDIITAVVQLSVLIIWPITITFEGSNEKLEDMWPITVSLLLISISWWENFVDKNTILGSKSKTCSYVFYEDQIRILLNWYLSLSRY